MQKIEIFKEKIFIEKIKNYKETALIAVMVF